MKLEEYILRYANEGNLWFEDEVKQGYHTNRISKMVQNKDYLSGIHAILNREDAKWKGKQFITKKTILNYVKTVVKFHDTYLLGKPVSLSGKESLVNKFTDIYKKGGYEYVDYQIIDKVNKFGDAYEVVYVEDNKIKSKVLDSATAYPVYDDFGNYISFIEYWTDAYSNISYYNVYYDNRVEYWNNEGSTLHLVDSKPNILGLPIHYHNINDSDDQFGISMLEDIIPIMDDIEDIMSKLGDSVYTNSLNPLPVALGQRLEGEIPADASGYVLNLDNGGDFKYVSASMDYNKIKLYLDNIKQMLNDIANIPSVIGSSTNIANISEVSMKILFHMATVFAEENEKWLNKGFQDRFEKFSKILNIQGDNVDGNVEVIYNLSIPVGTTDIISNLQALQNMGAISKETIMEKSDIVINSKVEKSRIEKENKANDKVEVVDKVVESGLE